MKKNPVYIVTLLAILTLSGCGKEKTDMNNQFQSISMEEAAAQMETEKEYIILDVRTEEEYASGHIPDAICIPNEIIDENVISLLPSKEQIIFVYCRSGNRSKQAAKKLADMGYTNIIEFGGILDWTGEIKKE